MTQPLWVFGYGSLMWDPGFVPAEIVKARLEGYARSFCLQSTHYRGTEEVPGLVLGLDEAPGSLCCGLAMRVAHDEQDEVLAYLRDREMITHAYRETQVPVQLEDGRTVQALTYVMRRDHAQYAGGLCLDEQARIIARAQGGRGPNWEYLFNTTRHLSQIGLPDTMLERLSQDVRQLLDQRGTSDSPPAAEGR